MIKTKKEKYTFPTIAKISFGKIIEIKSLKDATAELKVYCSKYSGDPCPCR
jgi:hypothetical protein